MKEVVEGTHTSVSFRDTLLAYYELTKPGITFMVLSSMTVGFLLASTSGIDFVALINSMLGTYLIASGTAAHNQYMERNLDKLMLRTSKRPLPMDRVPEFNAKIFSLSLIFTGLLYLIVTVNPLAGLVSLATSFVYLVLYTPLKQISFWNVPIGSIAGALPPVGGWAAATGTIADPGLWILFAIVFFWQIPHVLSIAWLCNDDYSRAGFRMLPRTDDTGIKTSIYSLICLVSLIPTVFALYFLGYNGLLYLVPSLLATFWFLYMGYKFYLSPSKESAKKLMFASIFYLPVVWILVLIDKLFF
jgi:protoheme IX farnesyltransferase